jgi:hypothetical protein
MNLLLFVIAFLFALSSISYQSLLHYKTNALIRNVFDTYMRIEETCDYNKAVEKEYRSLKDSQGKKQTKKEKEDDDDKKQGPESSSTINFRYLIDPSYPKEHPQETEMMEDALKQLIFFLYGDQAFFQEIILKRPSAPEDLFHALRAANEARTEKTRVNSIVNLNLLQLEDPILQKLWEDLLIENPVSLSVYKKIYGIPKEKLLENETDLCMKVSLAKYLNERKPLKLRIYLAPTAILFALLQNEHDVQEVLKKRKELRREVVRKKNPKPIEEATAEFEQFLAQFSALTSQKLILDFKVSTTNPSRYKN